MKIPQNVGVTDEEKARIPVLCMEGETVAEFFHKAVLKEIVHREAQIAQQEMKADEPTD